MASENSRTSEAALSTATNSSSAPNLVTLNAAEIEAKLYTLRSDREEWDRLADKYRNYWQLTDEIANYEWLLGPQTEVSS